MSRSPLEEVPALSAAGYNRGLDRLAQLVVRGYSHSGRERNCLYLNTGDGRFADLSAVSGFDFPDDGRAIVATDWDHDGDLDLWISNRSGPQLRFLRNDAAQGQNWLAVAPRGTQCNRDGIGARVEVTLAHPPGRKLIRTVRAGEGFLSQSGNWVHFGLGGAAEIETLVVRWPGGAAEEFHGAAVNGRYGLLQGTGQARPSRVAERQVRLAASEQQPPPVTDPARIWLASRPPVPRLPYTDLAGRPRLVEELASRPVLVNLWATWCDPCRAELAALSAAAEQLNRRGVAVLALCVDGLGDQRGTADDQIVALLREYRFPFAAGNCSAETVHKLEIVYRQLFGRERRFSVPSSFLIDPAGDLAALYFGPLAPEQLLADLRHLAAPDDVRRGQGDLWDGPWHGPAQPIDVKYYAQAYLQAGYLDDAEPLLHRSLVADPKSEDALNLLGNLLAARGDLPGADALYRRALEANPMYSVSHYNRGLGLAARGDLDGAIAAFRQALQAAPDAAEVHASLAQLLARQGRRADALPHFEAAVRGRPDWAEAHYNLGVALLQENDLAGSEAAVRRAIERAPAAGPFHATLGAVLARGGRLAEAAVAYRRALDLDPRDAEAHYGLGALLQQRRQAVEAIASYRRALEHRPDWPVAANALAWMLATAADAAVRRPAEAVRLAEQASGAIQPRAAELLDTLAAAYAAAGRYGDAQRTAAEAIRLAEQAGNASRAAEIRRRAELYAIDRPYVDAAAVP